MRQIFAHKRWIRDFPKFRAGLRILPSASPPQPCHWQKTTQNENFTTWHSNCILILHQLFTMILLRPNTTAMLFVALGMISALALPVPNDINDHSVQAQGENSKSVDRRSPMGPSPLPHPSANIQPVPKESQMSPTTGPQSKPMRLPPVAIPPSFPEDVQDQLYERDPEYQEPTWDDKVKLLQNSESSWKSLNSKTRLALRSSATYIYKEIVDAQIEWIQQTDFYRSDKSVKAHFDKSIQRVSQPLPDLHTGYGLQLDLEPDDMIVLGLADPDEKYSGASYLSKPYQRQEVHHPRWLEEKTG
ncbi:hypothetical protein F5878DRAFT_605858 [Lentinula raphanica]|uniref:Uncharacterized protein n=1 Tax=Lentinula raphanica TaxID=153919 RepID=A0AA38PHY5_9AGAR|nr:hypothetical protein F5878DRAFT_605858 [Lentinula raphanica]